MLTLGEGIAAMVKPLDYPAINGGVVTEGHARYCLEHGHATHTVNGEDTGICPRCGESKTVPAEGRIYLPGMEEQIKYWATLGIERLAIGDYLGAESAFNAAARLSLRAHQERI